MRLSLRYYDQNEEFGALLPRCGSVERFVRSSGGTDWALFHLDASLTYQNFVYDWLLLRSRWQGYSIGGAELTSVFVILVRDVAEVRDGMTVNRADLVAWGMVQTVSSSTS